jgi:outer membrane lipoprotein-sorting protein
MKMIILIFVMLLLTGILIADEALDVLKKLDANLYSDSQIIEARMIIKGSRGTREIGTRSYSRGSQDSFTEYLSPPREAGNKMLKLEDKLWIYDKNSDRIIQMSGHLLRQSVNGSDLSYEDFMEEMIYVEKYDGRITGEETYQDKDCLILLLTAKDKDVAYYQRQIWVDKQIYLPLKEELYGESGTLLKRVELSDIRKIQNRYYPYEIFYKDVLNTKGEGTLLKIDSIEPDAAIPDAMFSKASLRK